MESSSGNFGSSEKFSQTFQRLRSEIDRLVEVAWTRGEEVWEQMRPGESEGDWSPAMDLIETADRLVVLMNIPGVAANQLELTLVGNTLEVTGQVESLKLETADKVLKRERPTGKIHRVITLPVPVEIDSAVAQTELGVMKIELTKTTQQRTHKVPVTVAPATNQPAEPGQQSIKI